MQLCKQARDASAATGAKVNFVLIFTLRDRELAWLMPTHESDRELAWLMPTHESDRERPRASESWLGLCQPTRVIRIQTNAQEARDALV
jgi:hypothetical protein